MKLTGNIVTEDECFFGELVWEADVITGMTRLDAAGEGDPWVLPGLIDTHVHGLGNGEAENVRSFTELARFAASTGVTGMLPTLSARPLDVILEFLAAVRMHPETADGAKLLGSHLEGPYIEPVHKGGMKREWLRLPDLGEIEKLLDTAGGSLKVMTLSPELPGSEALIRRLRSAGVAVSVGHTGCSVEELERAVGAGADRICHLFDTFDPRITVGGILQQSLADAVLIDDRLMLELIVDGIHVPPGLLKLAFRAAGADRIIGITDAARGAGLPDGVYTSPSGREYTVRADDVCRVNGPKREIIGSCLTMNRGFINLVDLFGITPVSAAKVLALNPARSLGMGERTGSLAVGKSADIAVLEAGTGKVKECRVAGKEVYHA